MVREASRSQARADRLAYYMVQDSAIALALTRSHLDFDPCGIPMLSLDGEPAHKLVDID